MTDISIQILALSTHEPGYQCLKISRKPGLLEATYSASNCVNSVYFIIFLGPASSICSSHSVSSASRILGHYDPLEDTPGPLGVCHTLRTTVIKQLMRHSRKDPKGSLLVS